MLPLPLVVPCWLGTPASRLATRLVLTVWMTFWVRSLTSRLPSGLTTTATGLGKTGVMTPRVTALLVAPPVPLPAWAR